MSRSTSAGIRIKRVYEPASRADGKRVLVDRLWPRGLSKERAAIDVWMRDLAPSNELRKWFGHQADRWAEFQRRYEKELQEHAGLVAQLADWARAGRVTLVFGAKDEERNQAVALLRVLNKGLDGVRAKGKVD